MDVLHLSVWTLMSLCVFSLDMTVKNSDLKLCKDQRVCVTDLRHCGPRPPSSVQRSLDVSCSFQASCRSLTCEWSEESDAAAALLFSSRGKIISCQGIFNLAAVVTVTVRMQDSVMGVEVWSQPHTVVLYDAVKPPRPVLTPSGSTHDSLHVHWRSSGDGGCRLRYRAENSDRWTEAVGFMAAHQNQMLRYSIRDLQPFTAYRASVSCRGGAAVWSDWSPDVRASTLDTVPSRPPDVCYQVEKSEAGGVLRLHLVFKDADPRGAGGRILGYQVSYGPEKMTEEEEGRLIKNVTEGAVLLEVQEGSYSVAVATFNTAGLGPAAHLSIATQRHSALPPVRHLWVSSLLPATRGLQVRWENPAAAPSVTHYAVQWRSDTNPPSSHCTSSHGNSTVIRDVGPDEFFLVSVFPVYGQQCGPVRSLPVSLQQGAMMEAVGMKVVSVTKTTVTAVWAWQKKSGPIRVSGYRVMLKETSETQISALFLWPDQQQHTFFNLKPDTDYSLLLLADNVSRSAIHVRTHFDELPAVAAATPLLLLAAAMFITSILSRTVYKSYFFPPISSPRGSTAGQWLMDPNHQKKKDSERSILDMEDFQVTDVLGGRSVITVQPSTSEDLIEDASVLSASLSLDAAYVCEAAVFSEQPLLSLQPDYVDCPHPDAAFTPEGLREAAPRHAGGPNSWGPLQGAAPTSQQRGAAGGRGFFTHRAPEMACEPALTSSLGCVRSGAEAPAGQAHCSHLVCETSYIANS